MEVISESILQTITQWWGINKSLIVFRMDEDTRKSDEGMLCYLFFQFVYQKGILFCHKRRQHFLNLLCDMFVLNKDKGFVHFFCERTSFRRTPGQPNRYQEHTKNILRQWCFKVKQWNHVRFTNSNLIRSNSDICLSLACFHSFFHKKRLVWCWIPKFRLMNLSKYFLSTSHRFF